MELEKKIEEILKREPSVTAALIIDKDGIVIADKAREDKSKTHELAIEYVTAMRQILKVTDILKLGNLEEVLISTQSSVIVIRLITREYYLILITQTDGNIGKAKYLAKLVSEKLGDEFR